MKKIALVIFIVLLLALTYLFLWNFYPKNLGMFYGFAVLYLLDIYLYWVYYKKIWSGSKLRGRLLSFLYWVPLLMIIAMALISVFDPFLDWNREFRTLYAGIIFIAYASKLIPLILILLSDLIIMIRKLLRVKRRTSTTGGTPIKRSEFIKKIGLITGSLFFGTLTLGMFKWVYDFNVKKKMIRLPNLPATFDGLRIVQISDIHLGSWYAKRELKEAVQIVNDLNPDLVFFTGDLVNYSTDEAYDFKDIMQRIEANYGIYSTLGNHDYGDYKRWDSPEAKEQNLVNMVEYHKRMGWKLLRNQNDILQFGNDRMAIIGVENWGSIKRFQKYADLHKAIKGVEDIPVKLLLSHDPTHWQYKVFDFAHTIDLTFSGHTHGAQFGIEVPGMRWSPSQYIYKYWAGLYRGINGTTGQPQHLYVNRGLGSIGYPGRVGILPEITLIELKS